MDNTHKQNIETCRYNALVRAFSRAYKALLSEPCVEDFTTSVQVEMYSKIDALGEKENFSVEAFLDDVRAFNGGFAETFRPCQRGEFRHATIPPPILLELVRVFKNRAPTLGKKIEWIIKTNASVATAAVDFLIAEYLYLDRSASLITREIKNEAFRRAMFDARAEALYIAALNIIRSYASSMAHNALAADVKTVIGGSVSAN